MKVSKKECNGSNPESYWKEILEQQLSRTI